MQVEKICPTCNQELKGKEPTKKVGDVRRVIIGWKVASGVAEDDKDWNRAHFARHLRAAQRLLVLFKNDTDAVLDCIEEAWERIVAKQGLSLSLEGVVKNSDVFRQKWLERKEYQATGAR